MGFDDYIHDLFLLSTVDHSRIVPDGNFVFNSRCFSLTSLNILFLNRCCMSFYLEVWCSALSIIPSLSFSLSNWLQIVDLCFSYSSTKLFTEVDEWEIAPRFTDLLAGTSVLFFQDKVKSLHPTDHLGRNGPARSTCGGTLHLESGLLIEYDWYIFNLP